VQRVSNGLVLRTYPIGEHDRIVIVYTRDFGKLRVVVKGARRAGHRWGAAFEPLSLIRLTAIFRHGAELGRLTGCELLRSFVIMQSDPVRAAASAYLAELTLELTPDQDPQPAIYRLMLHVLGALEAGVDPVLAARYTELWSLKLAGHLPDLARCSGCGLREPARLRGAELLCERCARPRLLTDLKAGRELRAFGLELLAHRLEAVPAVAPAALAGLERLAAQLIVQITERPLRSRAVLTRLVGR
jgi:DNA repair protein RecO (recombination protein O)